MHLSDYLEHEGISQREFADRTGLSIGTISLLRRGLVGVSNETLDKIIKASRGKINEDDFAPVLWVWAE
jgi:transcriptional regulator with XRE-family HTH domain